MAGSWIKMRHDLIDAPEVRRIAKALGLDRDQVYGKLFRLWSWADRHGMNGVIDAEADDVDEQVGHPGFAATLVSVGWLGTEGGIVIPHWDRHNSDSAKQRALAAVRQEKSRGNEPTRGMSRKERDKGADPCHAASVTRLEKTRLDNPPPPPQVAALPEARATLLAAWKAAAKKGHVQPWNASGMPDGFPARAEEPGWLDDALRAIEWLPRCRYFDEGKATLIQMCGPGFVGKVLGHQYDNPKPAGRRRAAGSNEEKAPPRVFVGDDAEAFERTRRTMAAKLHHEAAT
jgi:hypothetical protein